jgi:hypothetical protein
MKQLFISGMFRSGTTLLARMFNAPESYAIASDPYAPVYKAFRNEVERSNFGHVRDPDAPLEDYYFHPTLQQVFSAVKSAELNRLGPSCPEELRRVVAARTEPFSPAIIPHLDRLSFESFESTFRSGLDVVRESYGGSGTRVVGFKEVWNTEFIPHLLHGFPESVAILIVRDPRAVAASNNRTDAKYPLPFLGRQWRKLSSLAWLYSNPEQSGIADRISLIRFEDLVAQPAETIQGICSKLGLPYDEALLDPARYRDGDGAPWQQNTSFSAKGRRGFDVSAIERWREVLTPRQIAALEVICYPEMQLLGYSADSATWTNAFSGLCASPEHIDQGELSSWIRPYSPVCEMETRREMALEWIRRASLCGLDDCSEGEKALYALDVNVYDALADVLRKAGRELDQGQ